MSKHNKQLKDYAGMTLEEALQWVEENCEFDKDCRRLRSRMVGRLLMEEIKKLRADKGIPVYTHDCEHCAFLGTTVESGQYFDLYHCKDSLWKDKTIVARYSNKPSGNISTSNPNSQHPAVNFGWYLYNQKQKAEK